MSMNPTRSLAARPISSLVALPETNRLAATGHLGEYQPTRVNAAFAQVKRVLEQPIVWKSDLINVTNLLDDMSGAEKQSLVNLLATRTTSRNKLSMLALLLNRAVDHQIGEFDGLGETGRKSRQSFLQKLVPGQDKANLARIFFSFDDRKHPSLKETQASAMQYAKAVADTGSAQQKVDFVSALRTHATTWTADPARNKSGRAIAEVMASMTDTKQISACLKILGREGMDAVVRSSVPLRDASATPGQEEVDTQLFTRLATAVSRLGNAREKAAFVAASGSLLDGLTGQPAASLNKKQVGELVQAISTVIGTDTTGVIENVMVQNASQRRSSGPAALQCYVRAAIDSGFGKDVGAITLQLQRGNDLQSDPAEYLGFAESRSGQAKTFVRARVMGGWLGIVGAAVQSRTTARDTNTAYASLLFSTGVDSLKEVVGARFPGFKLSAGLLAPAVKLGANAALLNFRNEAAKGDRKFALGLYEGALPRIDGVESTAAWTVTLEAAFGRRRWGM